MQAVLEHMHPSLLLPVLNDIRDRTRPDFQDYFHNRFVPDLRERGKQVPIIGYREDGRVRVCDGETSRQGALVAGLEVVPVLVYPEKPNDAVLKLAQIQANAMRRDLDDVEYARLYLELMEAHGWDCVGELDRNLHHGKSLICKRLRVLKNLPEDLLPLIGQGDGKMPFSSAYLLSQLPDKAMIRELAEKVKTGLLKRDSLELKIRTLLGNKKPQRPKSLKLKLDGVQLISSNPTLDGLRAFAERLLAAIRKLAKDGDGLEYLTARLNSS